MFSARRLSLLSAVTLAACAPSSQPAVEDVDALKRLAAVVVPAPPFEDWSVLDREPLSPAYDFTGRFGIGAQLNKPMCVQQADCDSIGDGSFCAFPTPTQVGRCLPRWWRVSFGWASR